MDLHPNQLVPSRRLSLRFDVNRLRSDIEKIPARAWIKILYPWHEYRGSYSEARLVHPKQSHRTEQPNGDPSTDYPPLLSICSYTREILDQFQCEFSHVRFTRMGPRSRMTTHIDKYGKYVDDRVRLHIPVITSAHSWLSVAGDKLDAKPGECWFVDTHVLHGAVNYGEEPRIHLIIDCEPNDFVNELLGFDIRAYRQHNILGLNDQMQAYVHRKQRWLRLTERYGK